MARGMLTSQRRKMEVDIFGKWLGRIRKGLVAPGKGEKEKEMN